MKFKFIEDIVEWWNTPEEEDTTMDRIAVVMGLIAPTVFIIYLIFPDQFNILNLGVRP